MASSFAMASDSHGGASDNHGGAMVVAEATESGNQSLLANSAHT
jgi:hypothetical protein